MLKHFELFLAILGTPVFCFLMWALVAIIWDAHDVNRHYKKIDKMVKEMLKEISQRRKNSGNYY